MKIALPVNDTLTLYKDNPHTAPRFAIYEIVTKSDAQVYFSLLKVVENKFSKLKNDAFDTKELTCDCDKERKSNLRHICDHYSLLELIGECSYLLVTRYCENTQKSMKQGGIEIFRLPKIINSVNIAIKNFIIGGSFANKIKHIHYAS